MEVNISENTPLSSINYSSMLNDLQKMNASLHIS